MNEVEIQFKINDVQYKFNVFHNLPNVHGLSLHDAVQSWVVRTKIYTANSLCKYICSKNTGYICVPKDEFLKLMNNGRNSKATNKTR